MEQGGFSFDPEWVINAVAAIAAALGAYYLGIRTYFRQKEYELVQKRYIDEGIDRVASEAEEALSVFRHNWSQSLFALKLFRDVGPKLASEHCEKTLLPLEHTSLEVGPVYRLKALVGDDIFWEMHQLLVSSVTEANFFFMRDLGGTLKAGAEGQPLKVTREEAFNTLHQECMRLKQDVEPYYTLVGTLQNISRALEEEKFSFKSIRDFKNTEVVKQAIMELRTEFGDRVAFLESHEDAAKSAENRVTPASTGRPASPSAR
ncbi:MAG TPA: hypothetical protein VF179_25330 [Thermoanaerobaculia bacterium]|nr:hypothetical protein [Thermoanaerobaculia bacterium]